MRSSPATSTISAGCCTACSCPVHAVCTHRDESESGKRSIATALAVSGIQATIYDAGQRYRTERERRACCLRSAIVDIVGRDVAMFVLEQDDTLVSS